MSFEAYLERHQVAEFLWYTLFGYYGVGALLLAAIFACCLYESRAWSRRRWRNFRRGKD
jgi:hypothetical protein